MHRAHRDAPPSRRPHHVHLGPRAAGPGGQAQALLALAQEPEAQRRVQEGARRLQPGHRQGDPVDAADGVLHRDGAGGPGHPGVALAGVGPGHQLERQAVRVRKGQDVLRATPGRPFDGDPGPGQPADPIGHRPGRDRQGHADRLPRTAAAHRAAGPGEEGEVGARAAHRIGVEEVVGLGVVLVHRALHEPHPQEAHVEVHVLLGMSCDGGDVVDPAEVPCQGRLHRSSPSLVLPQLNVRRPPPLPWSSPAGWPPGWI